jgi:hypothetical protein
MARRRKPAPWYHDFRTRLRFEVAARREYPSLRDRKAGKGRHAEVVYTVKVTVPEYPVTRTLTIRLANFTEPGFLALSVDGPTGSPHRYGEDRLCMWAPSAPADQRWTPDEGLLALIQYARVHLFREEYWRETGGHDSGVWAGEEAPHGDIKEEAA